MACPESDAERGADRSAEGPFDPTERSPLSGADASFGLGPAPPAVPSGELPAGTELGGVTIVRLLGEGGMGRVYEGRQRAPARTVAIKVMREGLWSSSTARRFEYEAQVLARLRHPHIAQIHTFGMQADVLGSVAYFVMEFVENGRPITRHADEAGLSVPARVALFRRVCAAVAHGHQKGVIHRDLKPANILCDGGGEPKVIDFGVARSLDSDHDVTAITRAGDVVGTLRYMSPEQLGIDGHDVDARSDVYALGLVLHELLAGCLPYELGGRSYVEAARILGADEAVSTAAIETATRAAGGIARVDARALATIVGTCLEKRPADRYSTASELEAELGRWERGEPLVARPPTSLEAVVRFARRHRAASLAAGAVLAALVAAVVGISAFSLRAERLRALADEARHTAERRGDEARREAAAARAQLYISNVLLAAEARDRDNLREAQRRLDAARELVGDAGSERPLELECLAASLDDAVAAFTGDGGTVTAVAWSRDGDRIASGTLDGSVRIWRASADAATEQPLVLSDHSGPVWAVAFSPAGRLVASASADGEIHVRSVESGAEKRVLDGHDGAVYSAGFAADGRWLVTGSRDGTARIWDVATGEEIRRLVGHRGTVYSACFSPDGRTVATASRDRTVRLWDADTGEERHVIDGHSERVFSVAFAPDGRRLATGGEDATARVWDAADGRSLAVVRHPFRVNAVVFVGDGSRIATASGDGVLRISSADDGRELARFRGHTAAIWSVACAAGTGRLVTGSVDGSTRLWDADFTTGPALPTDDRVLSIACAPDGEVLAAGLANSTVRLWDARTLAPRRVLEGAVGRVSAVRFTPDGRGVAGGCDDGGVRIWDVATGDLRESLAPHEHRIYSVDVAPDGRLLATAAEDRTARLWDLRAAAPLGGPLRHPGRVFCAAFSPDGALLATAGEDRLARLWRTDDGVELRRCGGHGGAVNWVAFSPDGRLLATACSDAAVRVWRVDDGGLVNTMTGPARQIWKVAFAPDGRRVAAVSADGTAQLWDVASGRATPLLRGHTDQVWGVAFAPDGTALFTGSWDRTARIWGVSAAEIARRRATRQP